MDFLGKYAILLYQQEHSSLGGVVCGEKIEDTDYG